MLSVAICDDEPAVCREIEELLAGQLVRADLDGNTRVFSDGESLVRAYERGEADFQIVFLDIKMQAMNGISAAREIRSYDEKVLKACGLQPGSRLTWREFSNAVKHNIIEAGKRKDIHRRG